MRMLLVVVGIAALSGSMDVSQAAEQPEFMEGFTAYQAQDYPRCAQILEGVWRAGMPAPQKFVLLPAECLAAAGQTDAALRYLDEELPRGRIAMDDLRAKDAPGLNLLRKTVGWPALLAKAEQVNAQQRTTWDQPLREQLLERLRNDQQVRSEVFVDGKVSGDWKKLLAVDRDNTAWLKEVVASKGWPGNRLVGVEGASAALLLVQHADADPAFQQQMLPLLEAALTRQDVAADDVALLTDRVLRAQGKPQRYGTQFKPGADGSMVLEPTEDEAGLDARRRAVGLPSMAVYKRMLGEAYHTPVR
ncbi:DUF6624 domain-containing protein [Xanthomonas campestris pv. plantaginis]|uniref:DUF6624 domain-containing protein n=1 Tax=Xanthomonas campestris TaxID=339 RepID=UPI002B229B9F|nr:DUF6624 domain-containing protein [Xanthomonas campestris]MEA9606813.1 DUF6624 domain-containing protein [Xanthomonas campestris pv. plantaginis]